MNHLFAKVVANALVTVGGKLSVTLFLVFFLSIVRAPGVQ